MLSYHLSCQLAHDRPTEGLDLTPHEIADAVDAAAAAEGTIVSAWIAKTAAHRLRLDAGRHGIAYDIGVFIAADRNDRHVWALHMRLRSL